MIAIIQYNAGNTRSVENALNRLGYDCIITADKQEIIKAEKVIFPGVGEASSAMNSLRKNGLDQLIPTLEQPVLGICLGLQLMCTYSEEGNTNCMEIFNTRVRRFPAGDIVPHMGWNTISNLSGKLTEGIQADDDLFYVHSYYAELCAQTTGTGNYIIPFSAMLEKDNFYATQFHPEKSASVGERILKNFLAL